MNASVGLPASLVILILISASICLSSTASISVKRGPGAVVKWMDESEDTGPFSYVDVFFVPPDVRLTDDLSQVFLVCRVRITRCSKRTTNRPINNFAFHIQFTWHYFSLIFHCGSVYAAKRMSNLCVASVSTSVKDENRHFKFRIVDGGRWVMLAVSI